MTFLCRIDHCINFPFLQPMNMLSECGTFIGSIFYFQISFANENYKQQILTGQFFIETNFLSQKSPGASLGLARFTAPDLTKNKNSSDKKTLAQVLR
jgi:hypothetical protein